MRSGEVMAGTEGETIGTTTELSRHLGGVAKSMREDGGVGDVAKDWRDAAEAHAEEPLNWIRNRPVMSVMIAAAIGYLFARLAR
jgi:ElaB/YqjD/DUF883 family membrane-anchored ribosome-binding protein